MDPSPIVMTVQRDGYWDGQYPRVGDTILVDPVHVASLELAGFAKRAAPERSTPTEKKHGR